MSLSPAAPEPEPRSLRTRAIFALLRLPAGISPIPGWFPLVVERVHPLVRPAADVQIREFDGIRMALDLREYVQRRIYYGAYEVAEASFVRRLVRERDVIVDVGANVGYFTLQAAAAAGRHGRVHAFEPVPPNAAALEDNIRLNGFSQVTVNRVAVADRAGTMTLGLRTDEEEASGIGAGGTSGHYSEGGPRLSAIAPVTTLDAYLADAGVEHVRLVKIDVEGAEPRVLSGLATTFSHRPPDAVMVEINEEALARYGATTKDVTAPLVGAGYELFRVSTFGRLRRARGRLRALGGVLNLVAVHPAADLEPVRRGRR